MDTAMIKRIADQLDSESFHNFLCQKGIPPQTLVTTFREWKSFLLLWAYSAQCKELHFDFEAKRFILSRFNEAAKEIPTDKIHNIQITEVLVSDVYELHSLCLSLTENGEEKLFRKVIKSIERSWTNIENVKDKDDLTEKHRRADLCIMALCIVSPILKDQDELKISLKKTADRAKHFTTDPDEALALMQVSELVRIAYRDFAIRDTKQKGFPEPLKRYTGEEHNLSTRGYILAAEIMFLISDLNRKFSNTLHQQIIEKLMFLGEVFGVKCENYHIENYRNNFLKILLCMEALFRLGISFTLENFPNLKLNQEEMERVRDCLISITKPEVWKSISCRWRAMTYAALTKWFYLNSDSQNAEICANSLAALLPKFLIQGNDTVKQNAHNLLESITTGNEMQSCHLEPIKFETVLPEHSIIFLRIPGVIVIQTMASYDIDGLCYQPPFQHILVAKEADDLNDAVSRSEQNICALQIKNPDILNEIGQRICNQFDEYMHKNHKNHLYKSWMGYVSRDGEASINNLCIVALHNNDFNTIRFYNFQDIKIYWRPKKKVSGEAKVTAQNEDIDTANKQTIAKEEAEQLFQSHRNLKVIHVSSVRSIKFQSLDEKITPELCVALYCQIKGIIPIGENVFPKKIGHLRTDVREGYAVFDGEKSRRPGPRMYCRSTDTPGTIGTYANSHDEKTWIYHCSSPSCNQ